MDSDKLPPSTIVARLGGKTQIGLILFCRPEKILDLEAADFWAVFSNRWAGFGRFFWIFFRKQQKTLPSAKFFLRFGETSVESKKLQRPNKNLFFVILYLGQIGLT